MQPMIGTNTSARRLQNGESDTFIKGLMGEPVGFAPELVDASTVCGEKEKEERERVSEGERKDEKRRTDRGRES
jgi:hypothetical protein